MGALKLRNKRIVVSNKYFHIDKLYERLIKQMSEDPADLEKLGLEVNRC